uniref:uncharacterized protein LOC108592410 n=1 Tax=Callithrix jacchus TaxID=9483 RepID=UPI0023DCF676|nr:uncharacterized protein LOC108592410 [Callithrix jacchus]
MVSARGIPLLLLESRSSHTLSSSPQHSWRSPSPWPAFLPSTLSPRPPSPPCDRRRERRGSGARTRLLRSPLRAPPPPSGLRAPASSPSPPPNGCCFGLRGSKTTAEAPPAPRSATAQGGRHSDPPPSVLPGAAESNKPRAGAAVRTPGVLGRSTRPRAPAAAPPLSSAAPPVGTACPLGFEPRCGSHGSRVPSPGASSPPEPLPEEALPSRCGCFWQKGLDHRTAVFTARPSSGGLALPRRLGHHCSPRWPRFLPAPA